MASIVTEAQSLLHEHNLDLAEFYDNYAFLLVNDDVSKANLNVKQAAKYVAKSAAIVKNAYGEKSVEYAYELRKLGEMSLRLGELSAAFGHLNKSKDILESCYSSRHGDVVELAEMLRQLEGLSGSGGLRN